MRTKLFLSLLVYAMTNTLFAQNVGDYQTAGSGPANWHNPSSWQVWNGSTWIAATNYPGQINGTYNVEIMNDHLITMQSNINNLPNKFGTLTINGEIRIFNNQNVYINATSTIVTEGMGVINFVQNANLYFPANMAFSVVPGGLLPADESNACNASKRIYIGAILFSSCNGNGPGDPISFWELMEAGGNLISVITAAFTDCNAATFNATLTPSFIGLEGSGTSFTWTITDPNNVSMNSQDNPLILDLNVEGVYQFDLTYTTIYEGDEYYNTRTVDYTNKLTKWTSNGWTNENPTIDTRVIIAYDYNGPSFSACFLKVNEEATLSITGDNYVEVAGSVQNDGTIEITENGSLVQINNDATFTGTNNTVTRTSRPMKKWDYVYWGSPIETPTILTTAPISTYFDVSYRWNLSGTATGNWAGLTQTPAIGNGFISRVRASLFPAGSPLNATALTHFVFNGKLNSGPISIYANVFPDGDVNVDNGNSVLLSNPYPSAINAITLLTSNTQIDKLLFWTSYTVYTGSGQYQVSDYATFNLTGGTGLGESPTSTGETTDLTPQGYIASGQGFFAHVTTPSAIEFNNVMRVRGSNSQFFRSSEPETFNDVTTGFERHRLWINFSNDTNANRQLLIGYLEGATNEYDNRYDAISSTTNQIDIYTILEDTKKLTIQGRALPFNNTDIIPLGYRVTNPGNYTITLSDMDGLFTDYDDILLKNKITNTYHNLKNGSFTFNAQAGTFNDHFEIHFAEQLLGINPIGSANNLLIYGANGALNVKGFETNIQSIEVFDLVGKLLFAVNDVNTLDYISPSINTISPILIARVTDKNNQVTTKKVIFK